MADAYMPAIHLKQENRLRIRLCSVTVDSISGGGARLMLELFTTGHAEGDGTKRVLTVVQEAPAYRATPVDNKPDYAQVTAEATARLREDLLTIIESLESMEGDVRRRGRPEE